MIIHPEPAVGKEGYRQLSGSQVFAVFGDQQMQALEKKGAALILELGELEARLSDPVPDPIEVLRRERRRVEQELEALMRTDEPTEGSPELSRAAHVDHVREQFQELDKITAIATNEIDGEKLRPSAVVSPTTAMPPSRPA